METVRYSLEILTNQFINEQTRENFVTMGTPSPGEYKMAEPYFTQYGIKPEEAYKVLLDFDKEPKDLTQDELNTRIRALSALDMALNNKEFIMSIKTQLNSNIRAGGPQYNELVVNNIDAGIAIMRRLIGLLIMESASACSTDNCFDNILGNPKFSFKRTSISDKIEKINQTNNQTIMSLKTDLNDKSEKNKEFTGIIQLDKQTIKSLNTMLSEKNNEIEKKQNENAELSKMYKSAFAQRDEMAEKNKILAEESKKIVEESKKLVTIPNVLIVVLVCIIVYLFVTKK